MAIKQKKEWFLHNDGENQGPFTLMEVRKHFQDKKINENTLVWQKGMKEWEYVKKVSAVTQKEFPSQLAAMEGSDMKSDPLLMEAGYESHKTQTDLTIKRKKATKEKLKAEPQEKPVPEFKRRRSASGSLDTGSLLSKVGERTITKRLALEFPLEESKKEDSESQPEVNQKKAFEKTPDLIIDKGSSLDDRDELTLAEKVSIITSLQEDKNTDASKYGVAPEEASSETQPSIFLLDEKEGTLKEVEEGEVETEADEPGSILTDVMKQKEQLEVDFSSMKEPLEKEKVKEVEERTRDIEVEDSKGFKEEDKIWTLKTEEGLYPAALSYQELLDMGVAGNLPSKFFLKKSGSKDFFPETNFPDLVAASKLGKKSIASLLSFSKKDVASVREKSPPLPKEEEKSAGSIREEKKDFSINTELPAASLEESFREKEVKKKPAKKPAIPEEGLSAAKTAKEEKVDVKKAVTEEEKELTGTGINIFEKLKSSSFIRLKKGITEDVRKADTFKIKKEEEKVGELKQEENKAVEDGRKEENRPSLKEILQKKEKKKIEVTYIEKPKQSKIASIFHFFKMMFYLTIFAALAYLGFIVYKSISISHYFKNFPDIAGISLVDYEKIKKLISQERIGDRSSFTYVLSKDGPSSHSIHVATNAEAGRVMKMQLYGEAGELVNRLSLSLEREKKIPSSGIVSFGPLRDDNANPLPMGKYRIRMQIEGEKSAYSSRFLLGGTSQEDYERRMKLYKEKLQNRYDKEYAELRQLVQTTLSVYSKLHTALKNMKSKKKESFPSYVAWKKFLANTGILMKDMERSITKNLAEDQVPLFYPLYYGELRKLSQGIKVLLSKEKEIWESSQPLLTSGIQKISASKNRLVSFLTFAEPDEPAKVLVRNYGGDSYHRVEEFFSDGEL